ncbi:hypothetical protein OFN53_35995, partial [Escherichia coli]|nr:hypothetical protein [Escherichia coli]
MRAHNKMTTAVDTRVDVPAAREGDPAPVDGDGSPDCQPAAARAPAAPAVVKDAWFTPQTGDSRGRK